MAGTNHWLMALLASLVIAGFLWTRLHNTQSGAAGNATSDSQGPMSTETLLRPKSKDIAADTSGKGTAWEEETAWGRELTKSKRSYSRGDLRVEPHPANHWLDGVSVYRGRRLILRQTLHADLDYSDGMKLTFPYTGKRAKSVHKFDGGWSDFIADNEEPGLNPLTDLNGDGVPDLIVTGFSNGGDKYKLYSLGRKATLLATLHTVRSSASFKDIDNDGKYEVLACDPTFFGWQVCNAESPMPLVILKMSGKKLKLATALMRTQPPTKERSNKLLVDWHRACKDRAGTEIYKDKTAFCLAPVVWGNMLELIYSGNSTVAFRLLDEFWSKGLHAINVGEPTDKETSKDQFKRIFLRQLEYNPYLNDIKLLNRGDSNIQSLKQRQREST
jgi:hypothetical protein